MVQNLFFSLIFGIVGAGLIVAGGVMGIGSYRFLRHAERADGEVVRLRTRRTGRQGHRSRVYYPTVRFTTVYGQQVETEANIGAGRPAAMPGERVPILYDPERPTRIRIDTPSGRGVVGGAVFAVVGLVFCAVSLYVHAVSP
ncbi:hypothetical protein GCM10023194_50640 [Planotetraspora phitsanulokensis]|uniref:DUF3592 domain-containing protein n=1 Tax=Planotetraspora phitsanulokensis TaxID=575192 RepID=A0A8J3XHS2_9ACTN|nr:DUF3592 domain-containing protein [Planotetraspora phitsanulokensis]GII36858.1 hypothetical protein Pph01_18610 [Planotetraspora phitsanulokensis]